MISRSPRAERRRGPALAMEERLADVNRVPVTAAVLAGGRSQRMGADKTLLLFDGEPMVRRVANAVAQVCEHVVVVTNRPEAMHEAGLPESVDVLTDEIPYQGPLGGLATALACAKDDWVLAVAADMPWLEPSVIRELWKAHDGVQLVLPLGERGPEPLLALYHVSCLDHARRLLASGQRRPIAIEPLVKSVEVPLEGLDSAKHALRSVVNINTPEQLLESRELADEESGPSSRRVSMVDACSHDLDGVPSEREVTLFLNGHHAATMHATPSDLPDLGVGHLLSEGLITDRDALDGVDADYERGFVYVRSHEEVPAQDATKRASSPSSSRGSGVVSTTKEQLGVEPVVSDKRVTAEFVHALVRQMARGAEMHRDTGGMHACGLVKAEDLMLVREDVGRHNALDKLLGRAWLDHIDTSDAVLLTTGRIGYKMAAKIARARIPIAVSRSAVTDLAVEVAERAGLTLAGYARGGKLLVYTNPFRISSEAGQDG